MEYLAIGLLLLITGLMVVDMSWNNILAPARNAMVFEERHQDYGAFVLRRDYVRNLLIAFFGSVLFFGLAIYTPKIIAAMSGEEEVVEVKKIVDVNLDLFEEEKKDEPPPPPVEPPPPVKIESVQFTQLEAVDKPVEEPPPTQEALVETNAGVVTQEGAKIDEPPPPVDEEPQIFTIVEEMPSFPGGEKELFKFLEKTMKYPPMAIDAGIKGVVYVTFVVDESGKVRDPKVLRGIGGGCDEEALRVIKAMPPWEPGKQRGKPVRVQYNMPVRFTLR